ncbi:MAG: class I SAM-dependent methyltransferase [candidate division Zixibacteria bacterium]|nr:class I SAM-dependent methyltransferase [candidate division Zixibacteria bacterium]
MTDFDPLLHRVERLKPDNVLDIGCGCGSFTIELAPHCKRITAIDISEPLLERCRKEHDRPNIAYRCMDGRQLDFPANHFDLVLARASLHHVRDWQGVVDEMLRVAAGGILIEEPLDDPRSDAKRNTMQAQRLFLELHSEVGYPHYAYVTPDDLTSYLKKKGVRIECEITRFDEPVKFDYFFEPWEFFADKSARKEYWLQRLGDYRRELGDGQLCENDILFVAASK